MSQPGQSGRTPTSRSDKEEMQHMKKELEKRGFDVGLSYKEIEDLFKTVVLSEKTAPNSMEQKVPKSKSPEPLSPIGQQSYADKLKPDNERNSKSPESPFNQTAKGLPQEKQTDSAELINLTHSANPFSRDSKENARSNTNKGQRSRNSDQNFEGKNDNKRKHQKPNNRMQYEGKLRDLKLTPRDFDNNEEERRLIPRYRLVDKLSLQDGSGIRPSESDSAIFDRLRKHLLQTAEICHIQRASSVALNFQWGTAIKVGETNGNFERKIVADEEFPEFNDNTNQPETSTSYSFAEERTRRRKRNTNTLAIYEYDDDNSDEERKDNSDEDFQLNVKRHKTTRPSTQKKATSSKSGPRKKVESTATKHSDESSSSGKKSDDRPVCVDVSDEWAITDDETTDEPPKKVQKSKSEESEPVYPRRIVPPNPGPKWAGIRARRPLNDSSSGLKVQNPTENDRKSESLTSQRSKSNLSLQDDEIAKALEKNDETDESEAVIPLENDVVDFRPLRMSNRMKLQTQRLVQIQEKEKEKETILREQERIKNELMHREKMRRVAQRIREEKDKQEQQEAEERRQAQREENWRNLIAQGSKQRIVERTELHPDGRPQNEESVNPVHENNSTKDQGDNEFLIDTGNARDNNSNQVSCPICNRRFEVDEIEAHAGACEEFDSCPPGISRSSSPSLTPPRIPRTSRPRLPTTFECEICQNFTTENGKDFENHSHECVKRRKYAQPFTPDSVIQVSTSPIRSVRTISELTNSEINYKSQFEPKTKSNKTAKRGKRRL